MGANITLRDKGGFSARDMINLSDNKGAKLLNEDIRLLDTPLLFTLVDSHTRSSDSLSLNEIISLIINKDKENTGIITKLEDRFKSYKINVICKKINHILPPSAWEVKEVGPFSPNIKSHYQFTFKIVY